MSELSKVLLLAQRYPWPAPRFIKKAGQSLLSHLPVRNTQLDDWSVPLVFRKVPLQGPMPTIDPTEITTSPIPFSPASQPKAFLRCLISTSVLDAGGID